MNNVFGRSMFAPKTEAREKLRNMGGIVASSAPLMQSAKGYAPGGAVNPWDDKSSQGDLAKLIESISGGIGALMTPSERLVNPVDTMAPPALRGTPSFGGIAPSMRAPSVEELIAPYSLENASGEQGQENDMLMQRDYADQRDTLSSMIPSGQAPDASMAPDGFLSSPKSETNNIRIGEPAATLSSAIKETRGGQNSGQATVSPDPLRLASIASDTLVNGDPNADNDAANALLEEAGIVPAKTLKGRVRQIESLYNDLIGFDDKDRNKQMYLMLAMAGAAMASGTSPDALTNISAGFKVGAEQLANFDAKDRERRDTISLKAIERGMSEMDAEAAARAATATKAADRTYDEGITADKRDFELEKLKKGAEYDLELEQEKAKLGTGTVNKAFGVGENPWTAYSKMVTEVAKIFTEMPDYQILQRIPKNFMPEAEKLDRIKAFTAEVAESEGEAAGLRASGNDPDWRKNFVVGQTTMTKAPPALPDAAGGVTAGGQFYANGTTHLIGTTKVNIVDGKVINAATGQEIPITPSN